MEDQLRRAEMTNDAKVNEHTFAEIAHLVVYKVEPQLAFLALSQDIHLARWWCRECSAEARAGGRVRLYFESHACLFEVTEFVPYQFIEWKCVDARTGANTRKDWVGAVASFQISRNDERGTELRICHRGLGSPQARDEWLGIWQRYIGRSLKSYLETGIGEPAAR
jgi:uncharacterized protein YndB with AHSA1/START domain